MKRIVRRRQKRKAKRRASHACKWMHETREERKKRKRRVFILAPEFLKNIPRTEIRYRAFTRV